MPDILLTTYYIERLSILYCVSSLVSVFLYLSTDTAALVCYQPAVNMRLTY